MDKKVAGPRPLPALIRRFAAEFYGVAVALCLVMLTHTVVAQPFYVPSSSMVPTLLVGDHLVVTKYSYGYSRYSAPWDMIGPEFSGRILGRVPERGDVAVFRLPRDPSVSYVKRVIGLPGDRIQMRAGHLIINDKVLPVEADGMGEIENDAGHKVPIARYQETLPNGKRHPIFKVTANGPLDNTDVLTVPEGCVFMMGDNRDNSLDSRVSAAAGGVGFVPLENLVGRVRAITYSWDVPVLDQPIKAWPEFLRLNRFFSSVD